MTTVTNSYPERGVAATRWSGMAGAETGAAGGSARWRQKSIQVFGTFGGATVVLQGSNDGTNWAGLTKDGTAAVSFTAAGIATVWEDTLYVRPVTSGGAGSSIDVIVVGVE